MTASPVMGKRQSASPAPHNTACFECQLGQLRCSGRIGGGGNDKQTHLEQKRWSTWTADTSTTALESGSEASFTRHGRMDSCDDAATLLDKANRDASPDSRSSPSPEDSLNAALAAMLSTANSLLISTMTARTDLARLQAMESVLDAEMDRREASVLTEIDNNDKMIKWMEGATAKLDKLLAETAPSAPMYSRASTSRTTTASAVASTSEAGTTRHWRAPSMATSQLNTLDPASSLGVFEAKDDDATISKSAAKRLEKMLQRASSSGTTPTHSRVGSTNADVATAAAAVTPPRPTGLRIGSSFLQTHMQAAGSVTSQSLSPWSESSEFRQRTPSFTSDSGPSSPRSSRDGESDVKQTTAGSNLAASAPSRAFLTPPTACEELPPNRLHKRSQSSLRSPHHSVMAARQTSNGSYISESALGQISWDEGNHASTPTASNGTTTGKGALEALRKLNSGSSSGHSSQPSSSSAHTPRWGDALASWVGLSQQSS